MDARQERAIVIAETATIERNKIGWKVPSQSGHGSYVVNMDGGEPFCTCPDFEARQQPCKHIFAVEYVIQRQENADGSTTYTERVTYAHQWTAYNKAQVNEQERFGQLLYALCEGIDQPPQEGRGRRRLPLADVVFSAVAKVYGTMSGRRSMTDMRDWTKQGYLAKAPSFNAIFDYLDNPALTPLLKVLIEESAKPLRSIERDFAVDSSGFTSSIYDRWYDRKYGKVRSEHKWVKAHLMCGVQTHIVTSVEVTPTETADAPHFAPLVAQTARNFDIREVSADKAYGSRKNLRAVNALEATPYIPFKSYSKGPQGNKRFDHLWNRMWAYYTYNRSEFMEHYGKRNNVETTFSMIKAKFGTKVRSKAPTAQVNEVLCKVLAHNICVLVASIYELGLEPNFWAEVPNAR